MSFRNFIDYDLELEEKVLGVFLWEPLTYSEVINVLNEDCFYGRKSKIFYQAIKSVYDKGYKIEYLSVQRHLYDQGMTEIDGEQVAYLVMMLMQGVVTSDGLVNWCLMLRELAMKRLMLQIKNSGSVNGDAFEEANNLQERLRAVMEIRVMDDWQHISQVGVRLEKHMMEARERGLLGVSTSIKDIDEANGGFRDTNLIVIGARPSVGKSAFMGRIATHAAFKGSTVGIISLEMEDISILARSVAAESDVEYWRIDQNALDREEQERNRVYNAMSRLKKLPIYFSDTSQVNMVDIRAKAEKLKVKHGINLLIIDYLQLIEAENANNRNREQEVSKISRGLKLLAMNMKIPIIILAQLNRQAEEKKDKKPELHHLRESGSIEQDADVVMFLHRDWQSGIEQDALGNSTKNEADLLIRKWRNGQTMNVKLGFHGPTMKFYDLVEKSSDIFQKKEQSIELDKPNKGFENRTINSVVDPNKDDLPF